MEIGAWEDPVVAEGDLATAVALIEIFQEKTSNDPRALLRAVYDLLYHLPSKKQLAPSLADLPLFEAKVRELQQFAREDARFWSAGNWLSEK